ncbi:MAG: hypothetical protein PHE38_15955 [Alishewanella agri]|nr:hypothetical protein [Alishewanella agri]
MWFEQLTGFSEQGAAQVRQMLSLDNGVLTSRANGKAFQVGHLVRARSRTFNAHFNITD